MKELIAAAIADVLKGKVKEEQLLGLIEIPPSDALGDYSFPCFSLAKIEKKNPLVIAEDLKVRIKLPKGISNADAKAGYLNFFTDKKALAEQILKAVKKKGFGSGRMKERVVIDYSAPNVAKVFGIHNLRSTFIGHAIYNLLKFSACKVNSINFLGDWGTQFGKLIVAYNKWGKPADLNSVESLNALYVKFHDEVEKDEKLDDEARAEFKKLEDGDKKNLALWKKFLAISKKEFDKVYKILGIKFDKTTGESYYRDKVSGVLEKLKAKGLLVKDQGAMIVKMAGEMAPAIMQKSDEASTYEARDMAALFDRLKPGVDKLLYVTDYRQQLHFEQVFAVAEKMGISKEKLVNVKFGLLKFKDEEMSTRKGKVIRFEELFDRAEKEILKIIKEKNEKLKNKEKVARAVALAAIIFADLQSFRVHDVVFDWASALSFDGKSGPYLMYTYARAASILRKAKSKKKATLVAFKDEEIRLLKKIAVFPEAAEKAAKGYDPSVLAMYAYELAQGFNEFYHACQVIGSVEEGFRLGLVGAFKTVMKKSLELLGIDVVEEM